MASKLLLIRHGPSAHGFGSGWVRPEGVLRWRDAYDQAGLAPDASPPRSLIAAVSSCDVVASSDLPRAFESMERLAPGRPVERSHLLRESPLPIPLLPLRLPVLAWDTLATLNWGFRILRGSDASPAETQRAAEALLWLERLGNEASVVAVATHGVFRRLLALQFERAGWRVLRSRPQYDNWSVWTAERRTNHGATQHR